MHYQHMPQAWGSYQEDTCIKKDIHLRDFGFQIYLNSPVSAELVFDLITQAVLKTSEIQENPKTTFIWK